MIGSQSRLPRKHRDHGHRRLIRLYLERYNQIVVLEKNDASQYGLLCSIRIFFAKHLRHALDADHNASPVVSFVRANGVEHFRIWNAGRILVGTLPLRIHLFKLTETAQERLESATLTARLPTNPSFPFRSQLCKQRRWSRVAKTLCNTYISNTKGSP